MILSPLGSLRPNGDRIEMMTEDGWLDLAAVFGSTDVGLVPHPKGDADGLDTSLKYSPQDSQK